MNLKIIFFAIIISLHASDLLACKVSGPSAVSIGSSLTYEKSFAYGESQILPAYPNSTVGRCEETALQKKFLMIALGPEVTGITDRHRGASYNGIYTDDGCTIENNPLRNIQPFEEKKANFDKHFLYVTKCIDVLVEHWGSAPLKYPEKQPGCQVRKLTQQSAIFNGGYCYFQPGFDSQYSVKVLVNKQCTNEKFLNDLGLGSMDIKALLNFYVAGDPSGTSLDLKAVDSTELRISVNPTGKTYPVSDDYGILNPTWPAIWVVPDVSPGPLQIMSSSNRYDVLNLPLIVDNRCKDICVGGECSSPCDFASPVAAEFNLYEIGKSRKEFLQNWYDGGIAPAKWQGIIEGSGVEIPKGILVAGRTYEIDVKFTDPHMDFIMLKKQYKTLLGNFNMEIGHIHKKGGNIGTIPEIPVAIGNANVPVIRPIVELSFEQPLDAVSYAVKTFEAYLNYRLWPPFMEKICNSDYTHCTELGGDIINLKIRFKMGDIDSDARFYGISDIEVERKSSIVDSYTKKVSVQPNIVCK